MNLVFDGLAQPIGLDPFSFFALVPIAIWAAQRYVRKRHASRWLLVIAVTLFSLINGIRIWDQTRIKNMLASGDGIHVTTGAITDHWHIVTRKRDWSSSSLRYKSITSEGFDIGTERFVWNIGDSYSPATFSNAASPPVVFAKGMQAEVTWFIDSATNDERRIVRLRLDVVTPETPADGMSDPEFESFHQGFIAAFDAGDPEQLTALTLFPFRFGAHTMESSEAATLWMSLVTPAMQSCVASTLPVATSDGNKTVTCISSMFVFAKDEAGHWRLREFREQP